MARAKFEPVSVEEDKPVKKSNRKVLAIIAVVVIILLLVVIAVVLIVFYLKKSSNGDGGSSSKAGITGLDGGWTEWKPWSECSATCEGGTQKRLRACADPAPINGGRDCGGPSEETRACADWACPDCNKTCPANGRLSNCTICLCDGTTVQGKVSDTRYRLPVAGAKVYDTSQRWAPLATTDAMGSFSIENLCVGGSVLTLEKDGYMFWPETVQVSSQFLPYISLTPTGKPVISEHPIDTAALVGGDITLNCSAHGTPEPTQYEWFKDGYVLGTDNCVNPMCTQLRLRNVNKDDSGSYRCRAISKAGKRFSDPAAVVIEESEDLFCETTPQQNSQILPTGCTAVVDSVSVKEVNVGRCPSAPCATRHGEGPGQLCCGPVTQEDVEIKCEGFDYSLRKVSSCGCNTCGEDQTREVAIDGKIRLAMRAPDGSYTSEPIHPRVEVRYVNLHTTDGPQDRYTSDGEFHFLTTPVNGRVVINFLSKRHLSYLPQVSVIDIPKGTKQVSHVVTLVQKYGSLTVDVDPEEQTEVQYGDDKQASAGTLVIPPERVASTKGGGVNQAVPFSLSFADPRDPSSLNLAPGTFTFEDEEGEIRQLQTFGVLGFSGGDYKINGEVEMQVNTAALGIPNDEDGQPDAWLWVFDSSSGDWKRSNPLSYGNGYQRIKRQIDTGIATARTEIPYPIPALNIDKPVFRNRECKVAVKVYEREDLGQPLEKQPQPLEGETVTAFIIDPQNGNYVGVTGGLTDKEGKTCLNIPCGFTHEVKFQSRFGSGNASSSHYLPAGYQFENLLAPNTAIYDTVRFNSPGPETDFLNEGPVYRIRSYGNNCPPELKVKYYFKFEAPPPEAAGVLNAVELRPHRKLSWNQLHPTEKRKACMVRVKVQTLDAAQTKVIGVSKFGDKDGEVFGTYTAGMSTIVEREMMRILPHEYSACVQVKCPEFIRDTDESIEYGMTPTYVQLNIAHPNASRCKLTWSQDIKDTGETPHLVIDKVTNSSMKLLINGADDVVRHYQSYTIYGEGYGNGGFRRALRRCVNSTWIDLAMFDCADGKVQSDWWNTPQ